MRKPPRAFRRTLCVLAYLLPLILGILLPIYAARPHLWYIQTVQNEVFIRDTVSLSDLRADARETCRAVFDADTGISAGTRSFAYAIRAVLIVSDVSSVLFYLFVCSTALCTAVAFCLPPTHRYGNFAKKLLRFVCPNRICFLLALLLCLPSTLLPQALLIGYRQLLGMNLRLHFDPMADWLLALIGIALCAALYIITLPWQAEERLDMYRIYKSRADVPQAGDEV